MNTQKFNVLNLGIALGVAWALWVLVVGLAAALFGIGNAVVSGLGSIYVGYTATVVGAIIGGIWALICGFIGGVVLAWVYNWLQGRAASPAP